MVCVVNIYVSHAWSHGDYYDKLFKLVQAEMRAAPQAFGARLHGLSINDAAHTHPAADELRASMRYPMSRSSVLVLPTGLYSQYAKWIDLEIGLACGGFDLRRRILAIDLFAPDAKPTPVQQHADKVLPWTRSGIIGALKELASAPPEKVPASATPPARRAGLEKPPNDSRIAILQAQFKAPLLQRRSAFGRA
jgi:hypothetical protein